MMILFTLFSIALSVWIDTNNFTGVSFRRFYGLGCNNADRFDINYFVPEELCVKDRFENNQQFLCSGAVKAEQFSNCLIEDGGRSSINNFTSSFDCYENLGQFAGEFGSYEFDRCHENYDMSIWDEWDEPNVETALLGGLSRYAHFTSDCSDSYSWLEYTYLANNSDWHVCHEHQTGEWARYSCEFLSVNEYFDGFFINVYSDDLCTTPLRTDNVQNACLQHDISGLYYSYKCRTSYWDPFYPGMSCVIYNLLGLINPSWGPMTFRRVRMFRDSFLMKSQLGREIIGMYYKYSPNIIQFFSEHYVVKFFVQLMFAPVILFINLLF